MSEATEAPKARKRGQFRKGSMLPEPIPHPVNYTVISVDDHLVEPPHTFEGRLPKKLQDQAPRIVETDDGAEAWVLEGVQYPQIAIGATAGRPKDEWSTEATRYSDIRPGCFDAKARMHDMDIDGVYASLNFPSLIAGMAGHLFYKGTKNAELGHALIRAWNDWLYEEWASVYPDRIIPCGLTWLGDPKLAAEEVRRNADRGFKALSFLGAPTEIGLPSMYGNYWDPLMQACDETETVICLHAGSDTWNAAPASSPFEVSALLFPLCSARIAADWLWSGIPSRFPDLKISLSEGGIAWVPMLIDRLHYVLDHSAASTEEGWQDKNFHPAEVFLRNFSFCSIEFGSGMEMRDKIGIDNIMLETDYPHADSSWPNTQPSIASALVGFTDEEIRKVTWQNASRIFRHPVPEELQIPRIKTPVAA